VSGKFASVIVHGRDLSRADAVVAHLVKAEGRAVSATADLSTKNGPRDLYRKATELLGGVYIIVNNAGEYAGKEWFETTLDSWEGFYRT
jgi:3-oxoacyl-[acyl-carrier protein] reductase